MKSTSNFKHFKKQYQPRSSCLSKVLECEKRAYVNVYRVMFQSTLRQSTCSSVPSAAVICMIVVHHFCSSLLENFNGQKPFLVTSEILRPFVNTLTLDE